MPSASAADHELDAGRLEIATAARQLLHQIAAAEPGAFVFRTIARTLRDATELLERTPRRVRTMPDFATLVDLRDAGLNVADHAMADRAVAGPANPASVDITTRREGDEAVADVQFGRAFEGAPGRVHGGLVAAVFDDVTGYALSIAREPGFTGRLTVSYRAPIPVDFPIEFRARYREQSGRKIYVDAEARLGETLLATAEALFITVDREHFLTDAKELIDPPRGSPMPDDSNPDQLVDCPRCGTPVDVTRPSGTPLALGPEEGLDGHRVFRIRVGREEVHRCRTRPDQTWQPVS